MGAGFVTNAGRLLGHLGDLVTLAFTPVASQGARRLDAFPSPPLASCDSAAAGPSRMSWEPT